MKVGIDVQVLGRERTGDETYYRNLVARFGALSPENEYWTYYTSPRAESFLQALGPRFHPRRLPVSSPFLRVPLAYPLALRREPVDVFHTQYVGVAAAGARLVLTVHDLSFEKFPETFPWSRRLFLKLTRWSCRRAAAVIAVSESTKRDLVSLYGLPEEKVFVVPNGVAPEFSPPSPESVRRARARYGLPEGYVLSVGALQPRKNLRRLVRAFLSARRSPGFALKLVLVGKKTWGAADWDREAEDAFRSGDILSAGYVDAADLPALYGGAELFAYPSLYEGFGLPVAEAMACGTPVVTSRSSSLPEVGGAAATYVDPTSVEDIAGALRAVASDAGRRRAMSAAGLERAKLFSWETAARKTLDVYRRARGEEASSCAA